MGDVVLGVVHRAVLEVVGQVEVLGEVGGGQVVVGGGEEVLGSLQLLYAS